MVDLPRRYLSWVLAACAAGLAVVWWIDHRSPELGGVRSVSGVEPIRPPPKSPMAGVAVVPPPSFEPAALFAYVRPSSELLATLGSVLPAPTEAVHYVRVNAALFTGKASPFWQSPGRGRVVVPLPDGGGLTVVIDRSDMLGADRFTSTGHIEGRPQSQAVFAFTEGFLHADVDDGALRRHVVRVATAELSQFYQVDPALVAPCGGERKKFIDGAVLAAAVVRRARAGEGARPGGAEVANANDLATAALAGNPQGVEVQVMMAVTQDVLSTLSGAARTAALQSAFDASIARVNIDLAASLISARVKLVKVAETTYDETVSAGNRVQDEALTALQSPTDGKMDELHALRDQCGADIVCLALNRADFASSGLAFVLDTPGDTTNALFSFSVVQYSSVAGTTVVSHEFGHSFGCAHDRENARAPGAYPYSYGYRFFGADGVRYRDIMAYPPGIQLGYFSNPNVFAPAPVTASVGLAAGSAGESDTARTIEQAAFEVSGYRLQTLTPPNAGALINVATRATVGPGERAVIAGFTVAGPQTKTMLVRAAGPALAALGVRDALPSPVLELYSGATQVAANTNWSVPAAAGAAISSAATQAGAFGFAPASGDAALLMALAPGGYTAVVSSAAGPGSVLVEAYEVSAGANRIVNLSTRGYADNVGHPIVAGFVVRSAPGATKRILVRVLGPSLGRAPISVSNPLEDPLMEIRNAAGELILQNDDWSTGAAGGASAVNDFSPLVRYYNEKQIAATGFAPGNRREPCLLADFPPGNYTVEVRPFEKLPDEPARPGVGLVEVFEITGP